MSAIANTILKQLGGRMFLTMTGASELVAGEDYLRMKLPARSTKNKCTHLCVTLDADRDLYQVEFTRWNSRSLTHTRLSVHDGIYWDMLQTLFTDQTGLYTRM